MNVLGGGAGVTCFICNDAVAKYKCPVCQIKYCSLDCYKSHKAAGKCVKVPKPGKEIKAPDTLRASAPRATGKAGSGIGEEEEEDEDPWRVPFTAEHAARILKDPKLKDLVTGSGKFREQMMAIDSAEDRADALYTAMLNPEFRGLVDQLLLAAGVAEKNEFEVTWVGNKAKP